MMDLQLASSIRSWQSWMSGCSTVLSSTRCAWGRSVGEKWFGVPLVLHVDSQPRDVQCTCKLECYDFGRCCWGGLVDQVVCFGKVATLRFAALCRFVFVAS